jgi:DNA-binding protein YbaB
MGMGNLQRMAMQMQQEMERIQAELAETEVEGSAGGGVVRATVTGSRRWSR